MGFNPSYSPDFIAQVVRDTISIGGRAAGRRHGVAKSTVNEWVRRSREPQAPATTPSHQPLVDDTETVEHDLGATTWAISMRSRTVHTYEQLVETCNVDLTLWSPDRFKVKSYQMAYVPRSTREKQTDEWVRPSAEAQTITMYSVTASFTKKTAVISARDEILTLIADAKKAVSRGPLIHIPPPSAVGRMLEIGPYDAHFGKYAWGRETGGPNYDLDIAVQTYNRSVETLLSRSGHLSFSRTLFVVGHDIMNADNNEGTTTKGTRQDNDGRFFKVFQTVRQTTIAAIERVAQAVSAVEVIVIPGNHDSLAAMCLGDAIECWFHDHPNVKVNVEPTTRKYVQHGRVLLGFTHGDRGKPQLWSRLMPVECPDLWGKTTYREVHVGHFHKDAAEKDELNGVKVRVLPSLAPPDAWHAAQGYVGNVQSAEAFHWDAEDGLLGTSVYYHQNA